MKRYRCRYRYPRQRKSDYYVLIVMADSTDDAREKFYAEHWKTTPVLFDIEEDPRRVQDLLTNTPEHK